MWIGRRSGLGLVWRERGARQGGVSMQLFGRLVWRGFRAAILFFLGWVGGGGVWFQVLEVPCSCLILGLLLRQKGCLQEVHEG